MRDLFGCLIAIAVVGGFIFVLFLIPYLFAGLFVDWEESETLSFILFGAGVFLCYWFFNSELWRGEG